MVFVRAGHSEPKLEESLRIGLPVVDRDHGELIALLDRFRGVPRVAINSEVAGDLIYSIGKALCDHFTAEERIMEGLAVPEDEFQTHLDDHNRIIEEYVSLQERVIASPNTMVEEILDTVRAWVLTHIKEHDLKIRNYL